jgi:hypothetical protein
MDPGRLAFYLLGKFIEREYLPYIVAHASPALNPHCP